MITSYLLKFRKKHNSKHEIRQKCYLVFRPYVKFSKDYDMIKKKVSFISITSNGQKRLKASIVLRKEI